MANDGGAMTRVRQAIARASARIARGTQGVHLLRELSGGMRGSE